MNTEKKYYKLRLCNFYEKHRKCTKSDKCNYAHGKEELREFKKECINGLKCFKKDCLYLHPESWNPEDNIRICEYYLNGYCVNEDNCKFKHIKEDENNKNNYEEIKNDKNIKIEENNKNIDINNNNEFPELKENIISDIMKTNDDILEEKKISELIKNNNVNELESKDPKYKDTNVNQNYNLSPNIEIFVNGIKNDMLNINEENDNKENDFNEIENLINNLQNDFLKYTKKIKKNIDETFIEDKYIYGINMKLELNKIMSKIDLLKNNYQDIINNEDNK